MFKKKNGRNLGKSAEAFESILGKSLRIDGNITFSKSVRLDGIVNGNILQAENSQATIAIGPEAVVTGDIRAQHVIISGRVNGNIFSNERVELLNTAHIEGDITYGSIAVDVGAQLMGRLNQIDQTSNTLAQTEQVINQAKQKIFE